MAMKLSACIENNYLFNEHADIPQRIMAAKAAGLDTVEFHLWSERNIEEIEQALQTNGMSLSCIVVNPRCGTAHSWNFPRQFTCVSA